LREVKRVLPEGPYLLGGFCSGAAIAYEMAQQIQAHGGRVGLLAAIDYTFFETLQRPGSTGAMRDFLGNALHWVVEDAIPAGPRAIAGRVGSKARLWWAKLTGGRNGDPEGDVRDRLGLWRYLDHQVKMLETYARAFEQYKPQPYRGRVALFRARTLPLFGRQPETDLGWSRLAAGGVDVHVLAGSHETIMKLPFVKKVASALEQTIVQATSQSPRPSTAARQPSGPVV
jgi:thioesterase domain-containing protein